jgi:molybdopterin/thiamine biosynthesis adenylyltransferase
MVLMSNSFEYKTAFSRNIGWLTESEQQDLSSKKVAIAGMGGVGGIHLLTLARLGISNFHIADFDQFDVANFNRQAGAFMSTVGKDKAQVMCKMAKDINPEASIKVFDQGVNQKNLDEFFHGVDIYIDGLDFFVLKIREIVFARAYELGIPCTSVAPLGMGASWVNIIPGKMSFDQYFGLSKAKSDAERAVLFGLGLTFKSKHQNYLVKPESFDFEKKKAPSTPMGCSLAAGVAATEALKILLKRGKVYPAPYTQQFDAYNNSFQRKYCFWGHKNPIQKFKFYMARKLYLGKNSN